ncbi:unnamed protein product, partial [Scytosiphon promiscuus]
MVGRGGGGGGGGGAGSRYRGNGEQQGEGERERRELADDEEEQGQQHYQNHPHQQEGMVTLSEEAFRKKCIKQAQRLLRKTLMPFRSGPYEVTCFGSVSPRPGFHTEAFIFPVGYRCTQSRFVRSNAKQYPGKKLVIRCDSEVVEGEDSPLFRVEHCGQLLAEARSGVQAWRACVQMDSALARRTVFRLVRCKSVLNRLCCSADVIAFLESVDPAEVPGYHTKITRPVHMRLVDERLKRGGYLNEFAFASDVRLAWSNAKLFNREGSELWMAADRLSSEFESLFCEWVLNPPDGYGRGEQGNAPAQGPWDEWQQLRYFDGLEKCRGCLKAATGAKAAAAAAAAATTMEEADAVRKRSMPPELVCSSCEDEWHAVCLAPAAAAAAATKASLEGRPFLCPRCTAWANGGGVGGGGRNTAGADYALPAQGELGVDQESAAHRQGRSSEAVATAASAAAAAAAGATAAKRVKAGTPQFQPHPGLPAGFQLRDDPPQSATTGPATEPAAATGHSPVVLTPTGAVVVGSDAADACAKAHRGRVSSDQRTKATARKRDVVFTVSGQAGEDSAYYLVVAGFDRLAESIDPAGSGAGLGSDGHLGLVVPDIKIRVEGLQGADRCGSELYVFKNAARQREEAEKAALVRSKTFDALQAVRCKLRGRLAEERWFWSRRRECSGDERQSISKADTYASAKEQALEKRREQALMGQPSSGPLESSELVPPTLGRPEPLFPSDPALSGCYKTVEQALMAWEFLSSSRDLVGLVLPPAKRMIRAITPPTGKAVAIPTSSELAFSEACMLLTKILLVEVRDILRRHMSKKLVDDTLAQRPINLLTWPEVAGDALVALANHRAHPEMRTSEMAALLSVRPSGWLARCGDMVAILISRPLAAAFVRPVDPALVPGYADVVSKPMDLSTVRRRLWSRRYQWHQEVVDDLRLVWSNAKAFNQENTDFWHAADSLSLLTESLYESWVLQPERRRDAESMKEAGLGAEATPAASVAAAAAAQGQGDGATAGEATPAVGVQVKEESSTSSTGTSPAPAATPATSAKVEIAVVKDEHPAAAPAAPAPASGTDATGATGRPAPVSAEGTAAAPGTALAAMEVDGTESESATATAGSDPPSAVVKPEQKRDQEAAAAAAGAAATEHKSAEEKDRS